MNECSVKIAIQRQVNESWELNDYSTVSVQGDVCHLVGDIKARRITHDGKENIQSKFTADSKLKPSTLHRKKLLILKTDHLQLELQITKIIYRDWQKAT